MLLYFMMIASYGLNRATSSPRYRVSRDDPSNTTTTLASPFDGASDFPQRTIPSCPTLVPLNLPTTHMGTNFKQAPFPQQESFASTHIGVTSNVVPQILQRNSQLTYEIDVEHQTSTTGYQPAQSLWEEPGCALDPVYSYFQEPPDALDDFDFTPSVVFASNQFCEEYFGWEDHGTIYTFLGNSFIDQGTLDPTRPFTSGYRRS